MLFFDPENMTEKKTYSMKLPGFEIYDVTT